MNVKRPILKVATLLLAIVVAMIVVQWFCRRHIHLASIRQIKMGLTTEAEARNILGPPNELPWDYQHEGFYEDYHPVPEGRELFWYGLHDCVGVAFDKDGIARGKRRGTVAKMWLRQAWLEQ